MGAAAAGKTLAAAFLPIIRSFFRRAVQVDIHAGLTGHTECEIALFGYPFDGGGTVFASLDLNQGLFLVFFLFLFDSPHLPVICLKPLDNIGASS